MKNITKFGENKIKVLSKTGHQAKEQAHPTTFQPG